MRAHLRAAQACMHLDRLQEALELYRQALDLEPQCMPAQVLTLLCNKSTAFVSCKAVPVTVCHLNGRLFCLQAGASLACKLSASKHTDRERESAAAKLGLRRGLDMASVSPTSAAELLLTADAMLEACPRVEAAKCARVEVR